MRKIQIDMNNRAILLKLFFILLVFSTGNLYAQNINMYHGVESLQSETGNFYDEGGPNADYPANVEGAITLTFESGTTYDFGAGWVTSQLQFQFMEFALGIGDTLFIYDGDDANAPLIGAYNSVNSPGIVTSTGTKITFVFYSDGIPDLNGLNMGWHARYAAYFAQPKVFRMEAATNQTFEEGCNAKLYDSGGPTGNFAANENYTITFTSNLGSHIKAEKVTFNLGSGNNVLEIYDGDLLFDPGNARRIGYFKQGFAPPTILVSSGQSMSFKFTSSGATGPGFEFNITCVPEIYTQEPGESACPGVEIGLYVAGQPFEGRDTITFDCNNPMIMLRARGKAPGNLTNDYMLQSIPYDPPFPWFGEGLTPVPTSTDDAWLGPKPLTPNPNNAPVDFKFTFYGADYTQCVPSTNGAISFNNLSAGYAAWSFNQTIPNTNDPNYNFISSSYNFKNCIFGVMQDTYPGAGSPPANSGYHYGNQGEYPCRTYVLSSYRLPQYSCTSDNLSTYQMVLYEGSNIIDIYVKDRTVCQSWNSGSGLLGILNSTGNQAVVPPGRNTGPWTAHEEAWRFIPISPTEYTITWYKNEVTPENEIPNHNLDKRIITVSPTDTTDYIAELEFETAAGITYQLYDTIRIFVDKPAIEAVSSAPEVCPGDPVELTVRTVDTTYNNLLASFKWYRDNVLIDSVQTISVNPVETTSYEVRIVYANNCGNDASVTVEVPDLVMPVIVGDTVICEGERVTLTMTQAEGACTWSTGATSPAITVSPNQTTQYIVGVSTDIGCITKDTITVHVSPSPEAQFLPSPAHVFVEDGEGIVDFVNLSQGATDYLWRFGDPYCIPTENVSTEFEPTHIYTRSGTYQVSLTTSTEEGCTDSIQKNVIVEVPYFFYAPNTFTPNGDGVNDYFYTSGEGLDPDNFEMMIYNRFGNLVFRSVTPFDYWDGRNADGSLAPGGVYVYIIITHDMEGNPKKYEGTVNLIR